MRNKIKGYFLVMCAILCATGGAFAQLPPPPPPPPCWPPPCTVPVNNGALLLMAGGFILGTVAFYKAWKRSL